MSYWNQFSPPVVGQSSYAADSSGVMNGGYDDDLNALLNPSPQLAGGTNSRPGILQDPSSTQALGEAWATSLSGLQSSQKRAEKQRSYDDKHQFWDELAGRVMFPLSGAIPGNRKHAIDASNAIMDDLAKRKQARREDQSNQMQLITGLAKVIKGADPEDMDNILEQRKLDNQLEREARLARSSDQRNLHTDEKIGLQRQKQQFDQQKWDKWFGYTKSNSAELRQQGWKQINSLDAHRSSELQLKRQRLQQQRDIAERTMDLETLKQVDREMDSVDEHAEAVWNRQFKGAEFADDQARTAAAVDAKGKLKYPDYKPQPAPPVAKSEAQVRPVMAKQGLLQLMAPPDPHAMTPDQIMKSMNSLKSVSPHLYEAARLGVLKQLGEEVARRKLQGRGK